MENVQQDTVKTQIGPWAHIPVWVLTLGLKGSELAVYVALRSFADRTSGEAHPHVKTIAQRAGVSERTVERALSRFRELDIMTSQQWHRVDGSIGGCHYLLRDIPVSPPPDGDVATPPTGMSPPPDGDVGTRTHQRTHQKNQPTTKDVRLHVDHAEALAWVVVDGTGEIGPTITRKTLMVECRRLASLAWTPEDLRWAVDGRVWTGCHAGAVIEWLRGLKEHRTVSKGRPEDAQGRFTACPLHPTEPAGRCTQCAREAVQAPAAWRDCTLKTP